MRFLILILTASCLSASTASGAEPFDNWYFKFFAGRTTSEGEGKLPSGEVFETGTGRLDMTIDKTAGTARLQSELKLAKSGQVLASESVLRHVGKGEFKGHGIDAEGNRTETSLEIQTGNKYTATISSEGVSVTAVGTLAEDGESVVVVETVKDAEGEPTATVTSTYRKAAASTK